jgi:lysophospholipase L1-like esterase
LIKNDHAARGLAAAALGLALAVPVQAQTFHFDSTTTDIPYDQTRGYGFASIPGGNERAFSVKLAPGDYSVTVTLGGPSASRTSVWAEDRRLLADPLGLPAGGRRTLSFIVNVRDTALVPQETDAVTPPHVFLRGDDAIGRDWDDALTVSVSGAAPALDSLTIAPVQARRVLIAGDSTVADQAGGDYASWGQMLPRFLDGVSVANHARSGETMKSFLTSFRWDRLLQDTRPGDVVLIQFGHNDEKKQWPRTYAAFDGAYPAYLAAFIADVRQRGAQPVLVTPVARLTVRDGKVQNSHAGYDAAVREVAQHLNVPLIDLTKETTTFYEALGADAPMAFANGGREKTHHNAYGAYEIACFVARDLSRFAELKLNTAADMPACTPSHPDDPRHWALEPGDWPVMRVVPTQKAEPLPVR